VVVPDASNPDQGTYSWTPEKYIAQESSRAYFPNAEGIDVRGNELFFVSKLYKTLYVLNLDDGTYVNQTTTRGLFDGEPDQIKRLIDQETTVDHEEEILYFTEDGGPYAGLHARNANLQFFSILESHVYADETTGLAFSPDSKHLYIAYQDNGLIFQIQRLDGLPFNAKTLNIKYHNAAESI
jgi:outer membrane protein assembly factor BamB